MSRNEICLASNLDVPNVEAIEDWNAYVLLFRDRSGAVWGSVPAALNLFEFSEARLTQLSARVGFPKKARQTLHGRTFWNLGAIESYLIERGRPMSGPLPKHVAKLVSAGVIEMPKRRRLNREDTHRM